MYSDGEFAISVRGVSKTYITFESPFQRLLHLLSGGRVGQHANHSAIQDISFDVFRGETVGIIGKNGSGKSTLLSIICGTLSPSAGEVSVNGKMAALLELGAGLNPELSGRDNIPLSAEIYGLSESEVGERIDSIIEFADIGDYIDQPVKTYSSGMFTRLAFAIIANVNAQILVVDEALAVGDAYFVQKCMRFLRGFTEGGGTLLFVSHDMGSVTSLCDRAIWLSGGAMRLDSTPKEVANAYLADLYQSSESRSETGNDSLPAMRMKNRAASGADVRQSILSSSNLRNDLNVITYSYDSGFGAGNAKIIDVEFVNDAGETLTHIVGGELVSIRIMANAEVDIKSIIAGFVVKDKNGQPLFGDNTYISYFDSRMDLGMGERVTALFSFRMPILPRGVYSLSAAISEGTQDSHVVHDWLHDAILFESLATSLSTGLVGIPMSRIELYKEGGLNGSQ